MKVITEKQFLEAVARKMNDRYFIDSEIQQVLNELPSTWLESDGNLLRLKKAIEKMLTHRQGLELAEAIENYGMDVRTDNKEEK